MSLVLDEHRQYLADRPRLESYQRAIHAAVRPGDVVLDLAAGTGILGFLACRAGAARVYAVDGSAIIQLAREFAQANGFADRITFINEISERAELPEPVDVIVCDQIGHMGFEAGVFDLLRDARRRFLKPAGITVPQRVRISVAALESADLRTRLDFWNGRPADLDVGAATTIAGNTGYPALLEEAQLLSPGGQVAEGVIAADPDTLSGITVVTVHRAGRLDGLCAWFDAELTPGIWLTNRPGAPDRINRRAVMLPIERPLAVEAGDTVGVRLHVIPADLLVTWDVEVERAGEILARSRQSTFRGMLVPDEDRRAGDPATRPVLTPAGRARLTVLTLCDGRRPLAEIERRVFEQHPALFATAADAAVFVGEVVTRYSVPGVPVPNR